MDILIEMLKEQTASVVHSCTDALIHLLLQLAERSFYFFGRACQ